MAREPSRGHFRRESHILSRQTRSSSLTSAFRHLASRSVERFVQIAEVSCRACHSGTSVRGPSIRVKLIALRVLLAAGWRGSTFVDFDPVRGSAHGQQGECLCYHRGHPEGARFRHENSAAHTSQKGEPSLDEKPSLPWNLNAPPRGGELDCQNQSPVAASFKIPRGFVPRAIMAAQEK